ATWLRPPTDMYTLSLHDALPIWELVQYSTTDDAGTFYVTLSFSIRKDREGVEVAAVRYDQTTDSWTVDGVNLDLLGEDDDTAQRSEEHTSELQSRENLVCRLLLE